MDTAIVAAALNLERYRRAIHLDEPYEGFHQSGLSQTEKIKLVQELLNVFIQEERLAEIESIPEKYQEKRRLLRALLNIRPPHPLDHKVLSLLNRLLSDESVQTTKVIGNDLATVRDMIPECRLVQSDRMVLWKGDITQLSVDAIVNAANNQLLGCFQPLHNCIDNVIHSASGPQLRQDCNTIMAIQQHLEQTGDAKITRAYHLPCRFVLHTVGPIIKQKPVRETQRAMLASCYRSCLDLAQQLPLIQTIVFPCISTGVFNFPKMSAAEIAITTVDQWLSSHDHHFERVIFNVYLQEDFDGYVQTFKHLNN